MHRARRSLLGLLGFVGLAVTAGPAVAQTDYFWNAPAGTGTWNTTTANWRDGDATAYTWTNFGDERANFGDTAGTVTLGTAINAHGLDFTTTGYTVTGNTLTLTGPSGVINTSTGVTATVNSTLAGTVGLTKTGAGTLVLGNANSYTGGTTINGGKLSTSTPAALPNGAITLNGNNSTLVFTAAGTYGSASTPLTVNTGTGEAVLGIEGLTGFTNAVFAGNIALNGPLVLQAGSGGASSFRLPGISGNGDLTIRSQPGSPAASVGGPKVIFTGTSNHTFTGNITIAQNSAFQLGLGTNWTNRYLPDSGDITFQPGSLFILAPSTVATNGETMGALISTGGSGTITTITPTPAATFPLTIGGGNKSGTFTGVITEKQGSGGAGAVLAIVKTGTGTQVFTGNNTYTGGTTINGGRLLVNGQSGTDSGTGTGAVTVNSGGTLGGTGRAAGAVTATGGRVLAGDGTAANQTLTLGDTLTISGTGGIRVVAGNGGDFNDATAASLVAVGGTFNRATGGTIQIEIDLDGSGFDLSGQTSYTRRVLTYGSLGTNLTDGGIYSSGDNVFNVIGADGVAITSGWQVLVGLNEDLDPFNGVVVQFTPVPEPGTVLALGAAGLALIGLARRRGTALAA